MPNTDTITADSLHESLIKTFTEGTVTTPDAGRIMNKLVRLRLVEPLPAEHFLGDFDATWEDPDVLDRRKEQPLMGYRSVGRDNDTDAESISTTLYDDGNAVYDFTINGDGRAHIGRVTFDGQGRGIRSTVMAGNFPTTDHFTGITLDPVPFSAMIQGF